MMYHSTAHGEHPRNVHLKGDGNNGNAKKASTGKDRAHRGASNTDAQADGSVIK